ncbi:MAG: alanine racemase [Spirochaetia bacterium]|nr:alanine racemase [Spirochaetia bacterium]
MARQSEIKPAATTWAEIDLSAFKHNFLSVKKHARGAEIIPVIKANAYGHGAAVLARFLTRIPGVKNVCVVRTGEGVELRKAGIKELNIIVLGGFIAEETADIIKYRLEPSVFTPEEIAWLNKAAQKAGVTIAVHLKVNTGMNRLGIKPAEAPLFFEFLSRMPNLKLKSVYTHFAKADGASPEFTMNQAGAFEAVRAMTPRGVMFHAAASSAIARYGSVLYDGVRPGIALYGSASDAFTIKKLGLRPVMSLKARVMNVIELKPGDEVSYGGLYRAKKKERIAIIAAGYGDGFRRELTNRWSVIINGRKCPVAGRICMDMTPVRVDAGVSIGDTALIFGSDGKNRLPVEEMAKKCGTISYEIFTGITERVKRIYVNGKN